jgi:hypothetical protein
MKRAVVGLLCCALASGCYSVTYKNPALPPNGVVHDGKTKFYLLALVGNATVPLWQLCPGGVSRLETGLSFGDLVLSVITIGIYTPRSYEVECGGGK